MLLLGGLPLKAQDVDTVFWSGNDFQGKSRIRSITETERDTLRTVHYWQGAVTRIEYQAMIKACLTPVLTDTVYSQSDPAYLATVSHHLHQLSGSASCDSMLRISTTRVYQNDTIQRVARFKKIGSFAKCPCGKWEFFDSGNLVFDTTLIPCNSRTLDNITLSYISWKPDSSYYLEVYKEQLLHAMPGQGSDHSATLILLNQSGETIKVISSSSSESVLFREVSISWYEDKNMLSYAKAKNMEWIDYSRMDTSKIRDRISSFLGTEDWDFFKTSLAYGDRFFVMGEFFGEPEYDRTLDMALLLVDSTGMVRLMLIDNYNYHGQEDIHFIDLLDDYADMGRFKGVEAGTPLWSNWVDGKGDDGRREFHETPEEEIIYLPYDALYLHAGESCGGGFIFWKDEKWQWLQQE